MTRPAISFLIPVFNGARHLGEALASLQAELQAEDEIIVADDGSTDDSVAVAQNFSPRIIVLTGPNEGCAVARNRALAAARNPWICFLDADDVALPDRIALLAPRLLAADQPDMVYGAQRRFVSPEMLQPGQSVPPEVDDAPVPGPGSILIRRSAFEVAGLFDPANRFGDFQLWLDQGLASGLRAVPINQPVYRRRRHANNLSLSPAYRLEMLAAVRRQMHASKAKASSA